MHIDHKQFLELITEAAGMDAEKAEKQLHELITEIKQSLEEDEAYEIEGFGIFSSLGNRIMFIPSKELETEVNFKYVGMEPIELDEPAPTFEDPFTGLGGGENVEEPSSPDSRFAGLIDDDIVSKAAEMEETPGPDEWGVEAHQENEGADRLFASLMGEEYEAPIKEEEGIDTSEEEEFDEFGDIFAEGDEEDNSIELGAEVASFMDAEEPAEEQEENDVDDILDDVFADTTGEDLIEEEETSELEYEEQPEDEVEPAPILELDSNNSEEAETIEKEEPELMDEADSPEFEQNEDFDDPFFGIEDEQVDESILRLEELDDAEIVPVIRNIATEVSEEEANLEKEKKDKKEKAKKEKKEKKKKDEPKKTKSTSEPAPAWLWVVLILVVVGGGVIGLGYFNIISIPFISSDNQIATTTPAVQTPAPTVTQSQVTEENAQTQQVESSMSEVADDPVQEQASTPPVQGAEVIDNPVSAAADQYGLNGMLSEAGNDGYTIILYTLSNQQNAMNERQKLIDAGYRGFLTSVANERYGTLYRVSVGQFATLFDAAVAAEEMESLLPDNYIIKKIN